MTNYDRQPPTVVQAAESLDDVDLNVGEVQVAEYVIYLLALDTYMRYIEENLGPDQQDELTAKGLRLLRSADNIHLETVGKFLAENLPSQAQKNMLTKALALRPNAAGAGKRALLIRTLLSRGGTSTMRAVFKLNKTLQAIRLAISASMVEDADAALDKLAIIPISNVKIRDWIDDAAKLAGPGYSPTPVQSAGLTSVSDDTKKLLEIRMRGEGTSPTSEEGNKAIAEQSLITSKVETQATQEAAKSLAARGEKDVPPTRSEVAGIIQAQVNAALTDPTDLRNVPTSLRSLDPDQRAAALTDGRVLVAAGAGSGKSTTLVSRVKFLVEERKVHPSRIFVASFNKKAGDELQTKVGKAVGTDIAKDMTIGTMHSTFRRIIGEYGTPSEKDCMDPKKGFIGGENRAIITCIDKMWPGCFGKDAEVPKAKDMLLFRSRWVGAGVSPKEAREQAKGDPTLEGAAFYYEFYEGLKGNVAGWSPPCRTKDYTNFMAKNRPNNQRLGDFDDMITITRDLLLRNPGVRAALQKKYDHVMIDEAQDLNPVQADIINMMAEKVDAKNGSSLWIIGDASQSIYAFRGADVDMFVELNGKEGWTTRKITTNYRCAPKIVKAANSLISVNQTGMMIEQVPVSGKDADLGSITVQAPLNHTGGAIDLINDIKMRMTEDGEVPSDFAVLCRTNAELHSFETACLMRGVPYARKGVGSFLGSPETKAMLSYVQLVTGDNFAKMRQALLEVMKRPNRFFTSFDVIDKAVPEAFAEYARRIGTSSDALNPLHILTNVQFADILAQHLTGNQGKSWKTNKVADSILALGQEMLVMKANTNDPNYKTKDLFADILSVKGVDTRTKEDGGVEYVSITFEESLKAASRLKAGGEDDEEDDVPDSDTDSDRKTDLGNIAFLYQLLEPDPTEPDLDASTPMGFKAKIQRYASRVGELRTDLKAWNKAQGQLPADQRKPPPGVFLSTVHSVKGAEWKNCAVVMPKGTFPMERPMKSLKKPEEGASEEAVAMEAQMESERRLGYVALTRAAVNLTIICPAVNAMGRPAGVSQFVEEAGLTANPRGSVMTASDVYDRSKEEAPSASVELFEEAPSFFSES